MKRNIQVLGWIFPLVACFLECGCTSFHRGYVNTGRTYVYCDKVTSVADIDGVILSPSIQNDRFAVAVTAPCKLTYKEVVKKQTDRKEKMLTVGFYPALPAYKTVGKGGEAFRFTALFMILGLLTPVINMPCQPFVSYYDPAEHSIDRLIHAVAWLGAFKWLKAAPPQIDVTERVIQSGIEKTLPLGQIRVECSIPAISYRDSGVTDERGRVEFTMAALPTRKTDVELRISDVMRSPYASMLGKHVGQSQTYRMAFSGNNAELPVTSYTPRVLKPPTWKPEAVALAQLTAVGTSVASAQTLSEWFYNSLAETRYFALMARSDTAAILKEQKFQRNDNCDDTGCLVEIGKILSVRRMIGGSIGEVGEKAVFTARMVDVETGEIVATAKTSSAKDSASILKMIEDGCEALCNDFAERRK
jgi:hypothetical protein